MNTVRERVESRIPPCDVETVDGMRAWFDAMHAKGLMFHPEDSPYEIVTERDGHRLFTDAECEQLVTIMRSLFRMHDGEVCGQALAAIGGVEADEVEADTCTPKP